MPESARTGKLMLPNSCMVKYLEREQKPAYVFHEILGEDLLDKEGVLDVLSISETIDAPYRDLMMAMFQLMESTEYTYLETLYRLDGDTLVKNKKRLKFDMYQHIQKSNLMPKFMLAFYMLGSTAIPYERPYLTHYIREFLKKAYISCSYLAPNMLKSIGSRLLTSLEQRTRASLARDLKWSSTSNFELNSLKFNSLPQVISTTNYSELKINLADIITAEISDTLFVAILNYIRAICGTQKLSWSTLLNWKIIKDCQLLKDSNTPFWNNIKIIGEILNNTSIET